MTFILSLYKIQATLKAIDKSFMKIEPELFAALDGAIDICEKAEEIANAVEVSQRDVDFCKRESADDSDAHQAS